MSLSYMHDVKWLKAFESEQQKLADHYQSVAAMHQRAADAARKRIKQLKRDGRLQYVNDIHTNL